MTPSRPAPGRRRDGVAAAAGAAGAAGLALFHHEPIRTDDELDAIACDRGSRDVDVVLAREDDTYDLAPARGAG